MRAVIMPRHIDRRTRSIVRPLLATAIASFAFFALSTAPRAAPDATDATRPQTGSTGSPGSRAPGPVQAVRAPLPVRCPFPARALPGAAVEVQCQIDEEFARLPPTNRMVVLVVRYRIHGTNDYARSPLQREADGWYRGKVPPSAVTPAGIDYYFEGLDSSGAVVISYSEAQNPMRISFTAVRPASGSEPTDKPVLPVRIQHF